MNENTLIRSELYEKIIGLNQQLGRTHQNLCERNLRTYGRFNLHQLSLTELNDLAQTLTAEVEQFNVNNELEMIYHREIVKV